MKDLTHYFVSPPKSSENGENSASVVDTSEKKNASSNETGENNKSDKTPTEKRSRVKIRITLKDSKNNSSCDIISNKNDVVDKTPSPLKRRSLKKADRAKNNVNNETVIFASKKRADSEPRKVTSNAFELLMTRNKPANLSRSDNNLTTTMPSEIGTEIDKKEYKAKLKKSQEKLIALAERKGYSKRKHAEVEEAEFIENRLKKRAKLFKKNDKDYDQAKVKEKGKKKKKDNRGAKIIVEQNSLGSDNLGNNNAKNNVKKNHARKTRKNFTDRSNGTIEFSQSENHSSFQKKETPKSKTKWTLRVKLQSQSEDDDDDDDQARGGLWNNSDEDYIFTPKSKMKYNKRRTQKNSSGVEALEANNPEVEIEELLNTDKNVIPNSLDSSEYKEKRHQRIKRNRNKEKNLETEEPFGKNSFLVNNEQRNTDQSVEILATDLSELDNEAPILLRETKLAPLFVKRSKPNPATLKARRTFLQSGIPENVKRVINYEQKPGCVDCGISSMPFPAISHVSQWDLNLESESSSEENSFKQKSASEDPLAALSLDLRKFKSLSNLGERVSRVSRETKTEKFVKIEKENFETVLRDVESRCSDTRTMWESISSTTTNRNIKKSPKSLKRTKKFKLHKKSDSFDTEDNTDNLNPTWTCKYKPTSFENVVGNETAASKLKNWLSGWRASSQKDDYSSGAEFYSSDCSSSNCYENNQVAVLLGPHGSGKSASVYAIAEELGYRVLEVNASARRTGKKILTDFHEATKSHRVKRDQSTLPASKKKPSEKRVPQKSLILIEDVDLIFEEDEGFVSATFQLAANTRRPIVMTCKEHSTYLNKMAPQQQLIRFQNATGNRVSALLELIAFAESGYHLSRSCLDILLRNGDLRQSLLQLQYILLSGPPSISQLGPIGRLTWQDLQSLIYKPAIKSMKKRRKELSQSNLILKQDEDLVESLSKKLDTVSLISSLTTLENPASPPWRRKLNPSLSLLEDFQAYSRSFDLGEEIADWLRLASIGPNETITFSESSSDSKSQQSIKRKVKLGIDVALAQAVPLTVERRSKPTDYLPIIRDMCRSEEDRASVNSKRGKRFHNYLHGLNLASASSNILSAASSVFKDKPT